MDEVEGGCLFLAAHAKWLGRSEKRLLGGTVRTEGVATRKCFFDVRSVVFDDEDVTACA